VKVEGTAGVRYMYHDPCHSPIKTMQPVKLVNALMGGGVPKNERCCGESGTLAMTRPDVSTQVRFSKEESLLQGMRQFEGQSVKVLTSCPSCLQGLARFSHDIGAPADYIVVELARRLLGEEWLPQFIKKANAGGIERVLL
jgi:Fe-S oxidoreductase